MLAKASQDSGARGAEGTGGKGGEGEGRGRGGGRNAIKQDPNQLQNAITRSGLFQIGQASMSLDLEPNVLSLEPTICWCLPIGLANDLGNDHAI